jgi:hypothetical protein
MSGLKGLIKAGFRARAVRVQDKIVRKLDFAHFFA